ncbi:MAG: hypothetical protein M3Q32_00635 [Pseudomonadota bacterium]|nr:hypothetical protein [Pseudomonadota bacterium]
MEKLLREREFSQLTGIPLSTLQKDRVKNQRIPFIKLGAAVYYDQTAATAALVANTFPKKAAK